MIKEGKQKLREKIWKLMEEKNVARFPLPCFGRIPNFEGSEKAAEKLKELEEWKNAKIILANPDAAQQKVRELALKEGKTLIMASPRLRHGYIKISPEEVKGKEKFASTIRGAFKYGKIVKEVPKPDLIITGCVAVSQKTGYRLGKGHAYGDQEIRMIKDKYGEVPVVTTVHKLQIVDDVPFEPHDTKVDIIVTPERVIRIFKV
jgi:5-formyltetrahydrofolate cyclo-ligase